MPLSPPKLDPKEEHFRIASNIDGLTLFLRYLPPNTHQAGASKIVLYVHGGTFPSALSIAHRFDGRSWRDALCDAGFDVWGLDFHGFGPSDPLSRDGGACRTRMRRSAAPRTPAGSSRRPSASSARITASARSRSSRIPGAASSPAASPGAVPSWSTAWCCSARSRGATRSAEPKRLPAWRLISLEDQWNRFVADVPAGRAAGALEAAFRRMGRTLSRQRSRQPDALAGRGEDAERRRSRTSSTPGLASSPTIPRDSRAGGDHPRRMGQLSHRRGCRWLLRCPDASPMRRDIKIGRATHLMHLEENRFALYRETESISCRPRRVDCSAR